MPGKIELYIRTIEHVQRETEPTEHMKESHRHAIAGYEEKSLVTSIQRWLPENEAAVKKIVEDFAKRHGLRLMIYDRHNFWGDVRARFKGIGATPTVILSGKRLGPDINAEQLESAMR